jgi:uncharacterized protein YndB with AHSA1/START domain
VVLVRDLRHAPEKVWAALTQPDQLSKWAPFDADRNLGQLGDATLTMDAGGDDDGQDSIEMPASVRRAEPPTLLEYTWGDDLLSWALQPMGSGTRLTLRHTVQGPDWMPKVAAGWHLCLVVAERLLDGESTSRIVGSDAMNHGWQELHDAYAARLGVAGTD